MLFVFTINGFWYGNKLPTPLFFRFFSVKNNGLWDTLNSILIIYTIFEIDLSFFHKKVEIAMLTKDIFMVFDFYIPLMLTKCTGFFEVNHRAINKITNN